MRAHGYISGRVQGVFFRASTRDKAQELGVVGWVKNLADGRVEFVAEGEQDAVESLVKWARQGPERARVEDMDVDFHQEDEGYDDFRIIR